MRRSMCVCEPPSCYAGEVGNFRFIYTPATNLPKGTKLRFDLATHDRPIDWVLPQTDPKQKNNLIWAQLPNGKGLTAKIIEKKNTNAKLYEFTLPLDIKAGEPLVIALGGSSKTEASGSRAQLMVQRRRPFYLFIDTKGKNEFKDQEVFHLDVRGNILHNIRVLCPSLVIKNKRFDVLVRFEDQFGNLTNYAPEGSIIQLSYEHQRENLNWKLFIPETGFINLPNLYFNELGVYKIQLLNLLTGDQYFSAPIKCLPESSSMIYWGLLHGESSKNNSQENIEDCLRQFRDEQALQFYGISPFESLEETSNEVWKTISHQVAEFNEDNRFCVFLGFQFQSEHGLRQLVYFKDQKPLIRQKEFKDGSLPKLYHSVTPKEALVIPAMTGAKGMETDFSQFYPDMERVVEIYNAWGSSECTAKEGNPRPIKSPSKGGVQETSSGSIIKALQNNRRFGFVAGGFDDRGVYSNFFEANQQQYSPGLTAILATEQSREALIVALQNRSCYATTGERIILGFHIAAASMGSYLNTTTKPGLAFNRHITGYVAGTNNLKEIALVRNGAVLTTFPTKGFSIDFTYDDTDPMAKVSLNGGKEKPPFIFYYLRVTQVDGHMAWTSPIWVDDSAAHETTTKKPKGK